jgi:hypothetical protein
VLRVTEGGGILSKQEFALDGDAKKTIIKKKIKIIDLVRKQFFRRSDFKLWKFRIEFYL